MQEAKRSRTFWVFVVLSDPTTVAHEHYRHQACVLHASPQTRRLVWQPEKGNSGLQCHVGKCNKIHTAVWAERNTPSFMFSSSQFFGDFCILAVATLLSLSNAETPLKQFWKVLEHTPGQGLFWEKMRVAWEMVEDALLKWRCSYWLFYLFINL